jgi:hypothetical protein
MGFKRVITHITGWLDDYARDAGIDGALSSEYPGEWIRL